MPGFDDIFKQIDAEQAANNGPILAGQGPTTNTNPDMQGYVSGYDAITSLKGLGEGDYTKGTLGDISNFDEGRVFFNEDLDKARAANQSTFQKWGNAALKLPLGVALGIGEIAGHMLDVENLGALITGAETDYDNWFSKQMRDLRGDLDEALPIYQREPGKAWDPGDTGWWANNALGLVESMTEFYAIAALTAGTGGIGGVISGAAQGGRALAMANRMKMLKNFSKLGPEAMAKAEAALARNAGAVNMWNNVAQAGNAFELGMATSAMNAVGTYQTVFEQTKKSINPKTGDYYTDDEAKFIASKSAASTYDTGLLFNSALNYTSLTPFFRGKAVPPRAKIVAQANETTDDLLTRYQSLRSNPSAMQEAKKWYQTWWGDAASEMGQEAVEEYGEALAGQIGVNQGKEMATGEKQTLNLMSEDMVVSAMLGLVGGGLGKGYKAFFDRNNDNKQNDALTQELDYRIEQLQTYKQAHKDLAEAKRVNDEVGAAKAESQLFSNQLFDSIINDTTDLYVAQMEEIAKMSIADARAKGFNVDEMAGEDATKARSTDYRVKAQQAIEMVKQGKGIASAVQQDSLLPAELKPHVMRTQMEAAFSEQLIKGLEQDIQLLDSQDPESALAYSFTDRLQSQVDALDSVIRMHKQNRSASKKQIAALEAEKAKIEKELGSYTEAYEATEGKKYNPNAARTSKSYLHRTQLYRELFARKAHAQTQREQLGKLMSLEHQKKTYDYIVAMGKRPGKKGQLVQKTRNLLGKFFALGSDGSPTEKQQIIDELRTLQQSGEFDELDLTDPNEEDAVALDTRTEVLQEAMSSFMSPEDLRSFLDPTDIGEYDEQGNLVDNGVVQRKKAVYNEDGSPMLDSNGRMVIKNEGAKTTLADLFGRLRGISNDFNTNMSAAERAEMSGTFGETMMQALLNTLEATFDADKQALIEQNKAKVDVRLGEMRDADMDKAVEFLNDTRPNFMKELGIEGTIHPAQVKDLQPSFNALAERVQMMYGLTGKLAMDKLLEELNGMIAKFDPRYEGMSMQSIVDGIPFPKEQVSIKVVYNSRALHKGKPVVRTSEGYTYASGKPISEDEILVNTPGSIEYINGQWAFIPESADGLDDREVYAIPLNRKTLDKPIEEAGFDVILQETYPIGLSLAENKSDVVIEIGNYKFKLSPTGFDKDIELDEDGNVKSVYIEDLNGVPYIVTDPTLAEDLADILGMYAVALQEFAEQPLTVTVTNVFGKPTQYKVKYFDVANPENSLVTTETGVDISHHKLKSEGGALTMKGKALMAVAEKFANEIVTKLSNEINQQQTLAESETQGTQASGQENASEGNNDSSKTVQERTGRRGTESFTSAQAEKIRDYSLRYESQLRTLASEKNLEALKEARIKYSKIANYEGNTDEVISQRAAGAKAVVLADTLIKELELSPEARGNNVATTTQTITPKASSQKGDAAYQAGANEEAAASLYAADDQGTPINNTSRLGENFSFSFDGLTIATADEIANPKEGEILAVSDGPYIHLAKYAEGKWNTIAILNPEEEAAALMLQNSDKAGYVKSDGTVGGWEQSQLNSRFKNAIKSPTAVAYKVSYEEAGQIYRDIQRRYKQASGEKLVQEQQIRKDLMKAEGRKANVQLFSTPNTIRTWKLPKTNRTVPLVTFNSAGTPIAPVIEDEHITEKGIDMLHNPTVTQLTHFIRFKTFENGNAWWQQQKDKDTPGKKEEMFPIYMELVDRITGEAVIVGRVADAKSGTGLEQRKAILAALAKGETVEAEIGTDSGFNRVHSMTRVVKNATYSNVLNTYNDQGEPIFYPVYDAVNGLTTTWHRKGDNFSRNDQKDGIVLLTSVGMDAEKSINKDGSGRKIDLTSMANVDRKTKEWLQTQLGNTPINSFTEGQIFAPMITPSGNATVVPLSTANLTSAILNDFFFSPLQKLDANNISDADYSAFIDALSQVMPVKSNPNRVNNDHFVQIDRVKGKSGQQGIRLRFYSQKHGGFITVNINNVEGKNGLIQALSTGGTVTAMPTNVTETKKGNYQFNASKSKEPFEISVADIMEVLTQKKFNVRKDKMNSKGSYTITNPTTGDTQTFDSYNAFVIGMPSSDNRPNMIISDKTPSGKQTAILTHNMMNNNGTVFANAGVAITNLSVVSEDKQKTKTKQERKTTEKVEKKVEKPTANPKGKAEVMKIMAEVQANKDFIKLRETSSTDKTKPLPLGPKFLSKLGAVLPERSVFTVEMNNPMPKAASWVEIDKEARTLGITLSDITDAEMESLIALGYTVGLDITVNGKVVVEGSNIPLGVYVNTKTGKVYERVTSVIKDSDDDSTDNKWSESAFAIGTNLDNLVRDFFAKKADGTFKNFRNSKGELFKTEDGQDDISSVTGFLARYGISGNLKIKDTNERTLDAAKQFLAFIEKLDQVQKTMAARGEEVFAEDIVLYSDELGLAGTVDLITVDDAGIVRIYDMKSMRSNVLGEGHLQRTHASGDNKGQNKYTTPYKQGGKSIQQQHQEQLSLYRILLANTHGLTASKLGIMPIRVWYDAGDTTTQAIELLPGIGITPLDKVDKYKMPANEQVTEEVFEQSDKDAKETKAPIVGKDNIIAESTGALDTQATGDFTFTVTAPATKKAEPIIITPAMQRVSEALAEANVTGITMPELESDIFNKTGELNANKLFNLLKEQGLGKAQAETIKAIHDRMLKATMTEAKKEQKAKEKEEKKGKPKVGAEALIDSLKELANSDKNVEGIAIQEKTDNVELDMWNYVSGEDEKDNNLLFRKTKEIRQGEQINLTSAKTWLEKRGIPFDMQKQVLHTAEATQGGTIHGYFHKNLVYLSSAAEVGTEYHEAFHVVFRTWTTPEQMQELLTEAKEKYRKPSDEELSSLQEEYPDKTEAEIEDLYYEEVMAEKFREYVLTNQKPRTIGEKLWKWIKDLFNYLKTYLSNHRTIDQLFSNIESGRINKVYERKNKLQERMYSRTKQGYNNQSRDHIVNAITSKFVNYYDAYKEMGESAKASEIFKDIRNDFAMAAVERLMPVSNPNNPNYKAFTSFADQLGLSPFELKGEFVKILAHINKAVKTPGTNILSSIGTVPNLLPETADVIKANAIEFIKNKRLIVPSVGFNETVFKLKLDANQKRELSEAIAYLDVTSGWNDTPRDKEGFLIPEAGWITLAIQQLKQFGLNVQGSIAIEELESGEDKIYGKDAVEENRMDSLSGKLKNMLARIPSSEEKILGITPYVKLNTVTSKLQLLFTEGAGVSSASDMMRKLQQRAEQDPVIEGVYQKILELITSPKMSDKLMVNEIYSGIAAMVYRNFHTFQEQVRKDKRSGNLDVRIRNFDSNSQRLTKILMTQWKMNSRRPGAIYDVDNAGNVTVSKDKLDRLKTLHAKVETALKDKGKEVDALVKDVSEMYNLLGVSITPEVLKKAVTKGVTIGTRSLRGKQLLQYLTQNATNIEKSGGRGFAEVITRLSMKDADTDVYAYEANFFKKIAAAVAQYGDVTNLSFMDSKGKNIFPVNMHSGYTRRLEALTNYGENDTWTNWLDEISKDPQFNYKNKAGREFQSPLLRLAFQGKGKEIAITTLDAYKRDNETYSNNEFSNLTKVGEWLYRFNAFSNNASKSTMYIVAPTLGDRGNSLMLNLPRISATQSLHSNSWGMSYREMLRNMIVQDIKSMQTAYKQLQEAQKKGPNNIEGLLAYYHYDINKKGKIDMTENYWKRFSQLSMLNNTAIGKELIEKFATTEDEQFLVDLDKATNMVNQAVNAVETYINNQVQILKNLQRDLNLNTPRYAKSKKGEEFIAGVNNPLDLNLWDNNIDAFFKDYVIADLISKTEIKKFTGGDVRQYKGGTVEEYSKRNGHGMTPGSESAIEGDELVEGYSIELGDMPEYTMAIIDDVYSDDDSYEFMQSLLALPGVNKALVKDRIEATYGKNKTNKTDGMGYTTIHKHRAKLLGTRGWSDLHEQAYNNYVAGLEFAIYDASGNVTMRPVLNPLKTFHDGIYMYNGKATRVIVKHSTFPLLREFTKNSPRFDKLRERMEATGEYSDLEPIDEVNHMSAVKTGIFNVNRVPNTGDDFRNMMTMPFKLDTMNQRIPQVIPDRVKVNKLGSQTMKLAPAALSKYAKSEYKVGNTKMTGKELFDKYQDTLVQMQDNKLQELYNRLGYKQNRAMTPEESMKFLNRFRKLLRTVVEERGLSNNYLRTLDIVPDGKGGFQFAVPMAHPSFSYKFEQMMISLFKNGPLNLTINGKAFVQIAEFGTHVKDGSLKFLHAANGEVQAAEIAIPWETAEKMGLPKDENGDYDISKIDERLLTFMGYRIPTQGKSAMLPLKVKRILPKSMGKVMLVPGEITSQMGSDFDIDKMYTILPNYSVEYKLENGVTFNKTREFARALFNALKETDMAAFTNAFSSSTLENIWENPDEVIDMYEDGYFDADLSLEQVMEAVNAAKSEVIKSMANFKQAAKATPVYTQYNLQDVSKNNQEQLENLFLDLTTSILRSPNHLLDILSPVDSNTGPNLKRIVAKLITDNPDMIEKLDGNDVRTEITLALRNRVGRAGIGAYAVNMTGAAVAEFTDSEIDRSYAVIVGNKAFTNVNLVEDSNGESVIYSFSKHLTMAVDNAKDPYMAFLNDNLDTIGVTSLFIRSGVVVPKLGERLAKELGEDAKDLDFNGGPVEAATVLRVQPIILAFIEHKVNNNYGPTDNDIAVKEVLMKYGLDEKAADGVVAKINDKYAKTTPMDFVKMVDYIGEFMDFSNPGDLEYDQVAILMNWLRYDAAATDLRTINKTIFNTDVIKNDMSSLGKMMAIDDSRGKLLAKEKPIVTGYGSVMFGDSYRISRNYTKMLGEMQNFMGNFMPHAKADFQVVTLGIKELVNKSSFDETLYDEISKFSMTYLLARPDSPVAKYFKPEYYIPLLYKQPKGVESNTVVDKLNAVKNMLLAGQLPDLVNNRFLASVEEHPDNAREKVLALKFNNGAKLTPSEQDDLIENFNDLFKHPNPVVRDLAEALLAYNIVAKGLKSGVDSFADLVPMDVMGDINAYMNRVIYSDNLEETLMFMATQFVENHTHLDGLISFVSKPLLEKATVTEQYIDFSSDVKAAIAMGQLKVKAKYAKAYVGNKIVTYRWNDKFNRYEGVERVGDKLSKVPVAKGVKYKLYELYTADSFAQVAAMQEEIDQRSECETGFGGGPSPDDFGPPSDIFFGGNFGGPNFDYPDFGPGPEIFY